MSNVSNQDTVKATEWNHSFASTCLKACGSNIVWQGLHRAENPSCLIIMSERYLKSLGKDNTVNSFAFCVHWRYDREEEVPIISFLAFSHQTNSIGELCCDSQTIFGRWKTRSRSYARSKYCATRSFIRRRVLWAARSSSSSPAFFYTWQKATARFLSVSDSHFPFSWKSGNSFNSFRKMLNGYAMQPQIGFNLL